MPAMDDGSGEFRRLFLKRGIMKKGLTLLLTIIVLTAGQAVFAQSVRVGPDGEFSPQTLKLPYAFYSRFDTCLVDE